MESGRKRLIWSFLLSLVVSPALFIGAASYVVNPHVAKAQPVLYSDIIELTPVEPVPSEVPVEPAKDEAKDVVPKEKVITLDPKNVIMMTPAYLNQTAREIVDLLKPDVQTIPKLARFVSDFNNSVQEETRAKITSRDPSRKAHRQKIGSKSISPTVGEEVGDKGEIEQKQLRENATKTCRPKGKTLRD